MLGAMRKLAVWKENVLFSPKLFGYGLLVCILTLLAMLLVYSLADAFKTKKVDYQKAYLAGVTSSLPFLLGLIAGSFILYPVHYYLGLFPVYGLLVGCCLQGLILEKSYSLDRTLVCYLLPALMGFQLYLLNLARP